MSKAAGSAPQPPQYTYVTQPASAPTPPQYTYVPPPSAPPSYQEAVGGVKPQHSSSAIVTTVVPIGRNATHMICPSCNAEIETTIRTHPGLIAYLSGFVIALLGCWLGCCLIPCCIDECMDVHHICPNCNAYLGRYRR